MGEAKAKGKKISRNKEKCAHYRLYRSVRNKLKKLHRHIAKHATDECALTALQKAKASY